MKHITDIRKKVKAPEIDQGNWTVPANGDWQSEREDYRIQKYEGLVPRHPGQSHPGFNAGAVMWAIAITMLVIFLGYLYLIYYYSRPLN